MVNVNTSRNIPALERGIDDGTTKVNVTMKVNGKLVLRTTATYRIYWVISLGPEGLGRGYEVEVIPVIPVYDSSHLTR